MRKYSNEYREYLISPQWRIKANKCLRLSKNKCALTGKKATHCHHLSYNNLKGELPVRDVVPLSAVAHRFIHCWLLWKTPLRMITNWLLRVLFVIKIILR